MFAGTYKSGATVSGVCFVYGGPATVYGTLTVTPGSSLIAAFALNDLGIGSSPTSPLTVYGDVNVYRGATFAMGCDTHSEFNCLDDPSLTASDTIYGNLNEILPLGVVVHSSTVTGSINELGSSGGVVCSIANIFGELSGGTVPQYSDYENDTIGGDLNIIGMQSCWFGALRDTIKGSMNDIGNSMADPDANEVSSNTIYGSMICLDNNPAVQFGDADAGIPLTPNKVKGLALGECAFNVDLPNPSLPPPGVSGPLTPISVKLY